MANEQLIADAKSVNAEELYDDLTATSLDEVSAYRFTPNQLAAFAAIRDARKDAEITRLTKSNANLMGILNRIIELENAKHEMWDLIANGNEKSQLKIQLLKANSNLMGEIIGIVYKQKALAQGEQNE
jgi:hypothetical protein